MGHKRGRGVAIASVTLFALVSVIPVTGTAWAAGTELVQDGSFEAGAFGEVWDEASTNFDTPICSIDLCDTRGGSGPRDGSNWGLFGGIEENATETAMVAQDFTIQPGTATLRFGLEIPECSGSALDTFVASIDGTPVFSTNGQDLACNSTGYDEKTIDVSASADGNVHNLSFVGNFQSLLGGTSFALDGVSLITNRTPVLLQINDKDVYQNQELSFTISAVDEDVGDALVYAADPLPPDAAFDTATGAFSWTPSDDITGTYNVEFSVTDGEATDSEQVTITVIETDPTTTSLTSFKKTSAKVKVEGTVVPAQPGQPVTVTLLRKRQGVFQPVRTTTPLLDATGAFATALRRTKAGSCMVQLTYEGDEDSGASSAIKTFRC